MGLAMLKGFMGIPEDEKLTFSILRVTVDGNIGRVYTEIKHDAFLPLSRLEQETKSFYEHDEVAPSL